ncbi:MAG: amino acid ABC transporter permease [Rhodocyclaceae bacterium]
MSYHWDWTFLFQNILGGDETYLDTLVAAVGWTVAVSLTAWIIALVIGSIVGIMRTLPNRYIAALGNAYVEIFRNIPILVQLFVWMFVVPELMPQDLKIWMKQDMPAKEFITGALGLGWFTAARIAEQLRAGIQSLSGGQRNAGLAMGFTLAQTYRYVLLPMAYRIVLPPLTSEFMNVIKNSAVTYAVGVIELFYQFNQINEETSRSLEILIIVGGLYAILAYAANRLMTTIEKRTRVPGFIASK